MPQPEIPDLSVTPCWGEAGSQVIFKIPTLRYEPIIIGHAYHVTKRWGAHLDLHHQGSSIARPISNSLTCPKDFQGWMITLM